MSDLNWCPVCDKAIHPCSQSLYCSLECLQHDAIQKNPLLGYNFTEFKDFLPSPTARRRFNNHHDDNEEDEDCHDDEYDRNQQQQSSLTFVPDSSNSSSSSDRSRAILTPPGKPTPGYPTFALPRHYRYSTTVGK